MDVLTLYDWPGNVREMENLIERLAILVDGNEMDLRDFPPHMHSPEKLPLEGPDSLSRLEEMEKKEVVAALSATGGSSLRRPGSLTHAAADGGTASKNSDWMNSRQNAAGEARV